MDIKIMSSLESRIEILEKKLESHGKKYLYLYKSDSQYMISISPTCASLDRIFAVKNATSLDLVTRMFYLRCSADDLKTETSTYDLITFKMSQDDYSLYMNIIDNYIYEADLWSNNLEENYSDEKIMKHAEYLYSSISLGISILRLNNST